MIDEFDKQIASNFEITNSTLHSLDLSDPILYHRYLYNQFIIIGTLESFCDLSGIIELKRIKKISADLKDLEKTYNIKRSPKKLHSNGAIKYNAYLQTLDHDELLIHIYVRHIKDIMENTELKNKVPGQKTMFNFEDDKGFDISEKLKSDLSSMLDIEFIDEANLCLRFMNELYEEYLNE
tara:strand:- start:542 stop:1081 length:540 start_codon:yes stop_codon:yes gene_type:complete